MEISGKALGDVFDPKDKTKVIAKAGEQLAGFAQLRDDGSTSCGNWIYGGCWSQAGNLTARRDNADPSGLGQTCNWGFAWPANRRIIYNRASCDRRQALGSEARGDPLDRGRPGAATTCPTCARTRAGGRRDALHHDPGRRGAAVRAGHGRRPVPEHYEPFETPLDKNPFPPTTRRPLSNPAAGSAKGATWRCSARPRTSPTSAPPTAWSSTSHFWSKHAQHQRRAAAEQFVEIGEELAKEKGIAAGDRVKVRQPRLHQGRGGGHQAHQGLDVDGKKVHTVGIPIHWGFKGLTKPGFITNTLTRSSATPTRRRRSSRRSWSTSRRWDHENDHGTRAIARYRRRSAPPPRYRPPSGGARRPRKSPS